MKASDYFLIENTSHPSDLIRMLRSLWKWRFWILISALCSSVVSGVYSFSLKERWTSRSEVIPNKPHDLGNYLALRKEYARILGRDINVFELSNQLFSKFDLVLNSSDERSRFFLDSELYHSLSESQGSSVDYKTLNYLVYEQFSVVKPDPKKEPNILDRKIYFSADTPEAAQQNLDKLIEHVDSVAYQLEIDEFLMDIKEKILDLKYEKGKLEKDIDIQNKVRLSNLDNALETAKLAGIKEYLKSVDSIEQSLFFASDAKIPFTESKISDGSYLFMLGEKYLKAQLDVLVSSDVIYPPRYYQISSMLLELEPLVDKIKDSKVKTIRYQVSPTLPIEKDKPNRTLIIILGTIIGAVLSAFFVLIRKVFSSSDA